MKDLKCLKDFGINQRLFNSSVELNQKDFFVTFFVKGVSKDTLGFEYNLSNYPQYNNKNKFFKMLTEKIKINVRFISSDEELNSLEEDILYLPNDITIISFYKSLRNSIAHHNYFLLGTSILFFSSFAGKSESACLERSWKTRSNFYYLSSDTNNILKIAKFLYEYFELR